MKIQFRPGKIRRIEMIFAGGRRTGMYCDASGVERIWEDHL